MRRTAALSVAAADRPRFQRRGEGRFTGRAAVLAILVAVLVLTLAYPVQQYLAQRSRIAEAERDQNRQAQRIAALRSQLAEQNDPDYIRGQAAERLQLTEPGARRYVIQDPDRSAGSSMPSEHSTGAATDPRSWYGKLWDSVESADQPPRR